LSIDDNALLQKNHAVNFLPKPASNPQRVFQAAGLKRAATSIRRAYRGLRLPVFSRQPTLEEMHE
jgi:hypothetical protein